MGRWIAIGRADGWDELERFSAELKASDQWRVDARTTITEVVALADGRLLAECSAASQQAFEAWLRDKNWQIESVTPVKHIARTGEIWKVG